MKIPTRTSTSKNGFSLIELLVVIAIIASLAAMSYGPIMKAIRNTKIEAGNKLANDVVFAIEQFEQKYDYLPYPSGGAPGDDVVEYKDAQLVSLLEVLMGKEGGSPDINPNNQEFFSYKAASNGVDGIVFASDGETPDGLKDPFGNDFTVIIDYTGDNKIELRGTDFNGHTDNDGRALIIRKVAIAGSEGPDGEFYDGDNDLDDVTSF
ncbi:type II secretion system protein [Rubritalea sp.]|uniref:type II secretion system protein n=1 Tax=Rubritalea sp. TaxID=2109375 RepID=UPI003EF680AB